MSTRNIVTKTLFIKLYKPKNPLTLEEVSKPIKIRPLNDVPITEDSTRKGISLDLPEIDDIGSSKSTIPETPGPSKLLTLRPSKLPEPKNKPLEPILKPFKKPIKPIDSSNPDEMQLNLITNLCYRVKAKIFKKKLDKNNSTPNTYKQTLKNPNIKE